MHELSLCAAIADIATRRAGDRHVAGVHVRIGELRQVVPDTLTFCWSMITAGTDLDGAQLRVERVAAALHCRDCGAMTDLAGIALACGTCGSLGVDVVSGEEFDVVALDLAAV